MEKQSEGSFWGKKEDETTQTISSRPINTSVAFRILINGIIMI